MRRPLLVAVVVFISAVVAMLIFLPYLSPFIIALIVASLLDPIVTAWEQYGVRRSLGAFILVFGSFSGIIALFGVFLSALWHEVYQLQYSTQITKVSSDYLARIRQLIEELPFPLSEISPIMSERFNMLLTELGDVLVRWVIAIPDGLFLWIVSAVTAYFICKDKKKLSSFLVKHLPHKWRRWIFQLKRNVAGDLLSYFRIQFILISVSTGITIGFFQLLGIEYALVLGLLAGFLDILPGIGPVGVYIPLVLYYSFTGRIALGLATLLAWLILFLVRQFWEPQLVGSQLGLHPLTTIVALYIGIRLFGAGGIILGPLLSIFGKALYQTAIMERN